MRAWYQVLALAVVSLPESGETLKAAWTRLFFLCRLLPYVPNGDCRHIPPFVSESIGYGSKVGVEDLTEPPYGTAISDRACVTLHCRPPVERDFACFRDQP